MTLAELIAAAVALRDAQLADEPLCVWVVRQSRAYELDAIEMRGAEDIDTRISTSEVVLSCS